VILVAGVDVGDVHFDDRPVERLDRIEDRNRGEGIAGRIDDDGIRGLSCGPDQVDQFALVIRLAEGELEAQARRAVRAAFLDLVP